MPELIADIGIIVIYHDHLDDVAVHGSAVYSDANLGIQAATIEMVGPADQKKGSYQRG